MPNPRKKPAVQPPYALVTGSARRVGRGIAEALAEAGYNLVLHCRKIDAQARQTAANVHRQGRKCWLLAADLSDRQACRDLAEQARTATGGRLDVLINNAGIFHPSPTGMTAAAWDRSVEQHWTVNVRAPAILAHALAPQLAKHRGVIINLADISWERPWRDHAAYTASKAALVGLTMALARDLAPKVRVNAICPGIVAWPENYDAATRRHLLARVPLKRAGVPAEVGAAVVFLVQNRYLTGILLPVDGGRRLT